MEFDVVIIGGGPGGRTCAEVAGSHNLKVALIEKEGPGGMALTRGYFPIKSLLHMAKKRLYTDSRDLLNQCRDRVHEGVGIWQRPLKESGVHIFHGHGIVETPKRLKVVEEDEVKEIKTKNLVIATGTEPVSPFQEPLDQKGGLLSYLGALSQEGFEVDHLIIIGGDVEGCEFATLFHHLGKRVTLLEMQDGLLPICDEEITLYLKEELERRGIEIFTGSKVTSLSSLDGGGVQLTYHRGDDVYSLQGDKVLVTGNHQPLLPPGVESLNLVRHDGEYIKVDSSMRTSLEGVYAIGDVTGGAISANAAILEGETAARAILGEPAEVDYRGMSYVFFTSPMITGVGLTERQLREEGYGYRVYRTSFSHSLRSATLNDQPGMVKLLVDEEDETLLGSHMVGDEVAELNHLASLVIRRGLSLNDLRDLPLAHPTLGEVFKEALKNL